MAAYSAFAEALLSLPAGATTGEAACVFAASGVPVFPVAAGGKQPLTRHWFHDATTDLDRVRAWWSAAPAANIGMPTGACRAWSWWTWMSTARPTATSPWTGPIVRDFRTGGNC